MGVPPPVHTRWKKGVSGNPGGRPKLPPELRKTSLVTTDELKRTISMQLRLTKEELDAVLADAKSSCLTLIIARTIEKSLLTGDIAKAEYLFMRLIGRVTEKVEVQYPEPVVIERPSGEQMVLDVASEETADVEEVADGNGSAGT